MPNAIWLLLNITQQATNTETRKTTVSRIIAVANQKGGVGKTTTSVNLSASLAAIAQRVLLVDLDPQGNATMGSGIIKDEAEYTSCDLLLEEQSCADIICRTPQAGYDLIPSNGDLTAAEVTLMDRQKRELKLKKQLALVAENYDFIIIDCPPSLNMLTLNALVAADGVCIPMQCEYYALEGLTALLNTIEMVRERLNPELAIEGLLRTMFDQRNRLANDVSAQLSQHFMDKLYQTIIPRNVRLAEAPSHGLPITLYEKNSKGALAYMALASEILRQRMSYSNRATAA